MHGFFYNCVVYKMKLYQNQQKQNFVTENIIESVNGWVSKKYLIIAIVFLKM